MDQSAKLLDGIELAITMKSVRLRVRRGTRIHACVLGGHE
jgi:hypothetical protein